jgi:hypothetical protein
MGLAEQFWLGVFQQINISGRIKQIIKFIGKCKISVLEKNNLKHNKVRRISHPDFKTYCKAIVT